jgi:hypothetical protein
MSEVVARVAPALAVFVSIAFALALWGWWTLRARSLDA